VSEVSQLRLTTVRLHSQIGIAGESNLQQVSTRKNAKEICHRRDGGGTHRDELPPTEKRPP
jgi:hypothetical protein